MPGPAPGPNHAKVRRYLAKGWTLDRIAKELGVSKQRVHQIKVALKKAER